MAGSLYRVRRWGLNADTCVLLFRQSGECAIGIGGWWIMIPMDCWAVCLCTVEPVVFSSPTKALFGSLFLLFDCFWGLLYPLSSFHPLLRVFLVGLFLGFSPPLVAFRPPNSVTGFPGSSRVVSLVGPSFSCSIFRLSCIFGLGANPAFPAGPLQYFKLSRSSIFFDLLLLLLFLVLDILLLFL